MIAVLTELADHPLGVTLDELAGILNSSKPTVHRALATLRRAGLADLVERGVYVLGDEYLRLAFRNLDGRPETARIQPLLEELAATYGETAHYAVLAGTDIVYRAKMDPPQGAVRLTSVIGGRNSAYRTAVGKVLLAGAARRARPVHVPARAEDRRTRWSPASALLAELEATRSRGYGIDDQENELGVNCVAIPVHLDGVGDPERRDQRQRRHLPLPAADSWWMPCPASARRDRPPAGCVRARLGGHPAEADRDRAAATPPRFDGMPSRRAGLLWGLVGVVGFSFTVPFTRVAVAGLSPLFIGSGRAVIAALLAALALRDHAAAPARGVASGSASW